MYLHNGQKKNREIKNKNRKDIGRLSEMAGVL